MRLVSVLLLSATSFALAGCEPTCKDTCRKLLECDEVDTPRVALEDCTASCTVQSELYEDWQDTQLRESFADLKQCVIDNECDTIADGVCYDEELFIW